MPIAQRTVIGQGYSPTAPTEWQYFSSTNRGWAGHVPPLLYLHGSGDNATTILAKSGQKPLLDALSQKYAVLACDFGLQAWGNNTHLLRIEEAVAYLAATWGGTARVTIVAGSMGNLGGLRYARLHPENVRAYVGIIPALDLGNLQTIPAIAAELVTAYSPSGYNDVTMGETYSPVKYADELDPDLPIHLWTASNDTITVPSTAAAFVAARPQTLRTNIGALGHTEAAVTAAQASVLDWLATT